MTQSTQLRTRVENAVRNNQQRVRVEMTQKPTVSTTTATAVPTIKLKTDFRNFAT